MDARRSKFEIIRNILILGNKGATKTSILYNGNLSFKLTNKYINYLVDNKMLLESNGGKRKYFTTAKGSNVLVDITRVLNHFDMEVQ